MADQAFDLTTTLTLNTVSQIDALGQIVSHHFMVTWFAGLFYLPRLFVYHAMTDHEETKAQLRTMERKLYYGITTPGGILTVGFGLWLWLGYGLQ